MSEEFIGIKRKPCKHCNGIMGVTEQSKNSELFTCPKCRFSEIVYYIPYNEEETQDFQDIFNGTLSSDEILLRKVLRRKVQNMQFSVFGFAQWRKYLLHHTGILAISGDTLYVIDFGSGLGEFSVSKYIEAIPSVSKILLRSINAACKGNKLILKGEINIKAVFPDDLTNNASKVSKIFEVIQDAKKEQNMYQSGSTTE